MPAESQSLFKPEAARLLQISLRTMSRYLASDDPPPFEMDHRGRRIFDRTTLLDWAEKPRPRPAQPHNPVNGQFLSKA